MNYLEDFFHCSSSPVAKIHKRKCLSNVNNINVDNDIILQTFRTSVRFLKRNNDDNKTVNGTYTAS